MQGRNLEAIVGACLYMACRQEQVPRTFKEICAVCQVSKKEIGRVFKLIMKSVDTKLDVPVISSNDYLDRFATLLALPHNVVRIARDIAQRIATLDLCRGRSPVSVGALYLFKESYRLFKQTKLLQLQQSLFWPQLRSMQIRALPKLPKQLAWRNQQSEGYIRICTLLLQSYSSTIRDL